VFSLDLNKEVMGRGFIAGHDLFGQHLKLNSFGFHPAPEWQLLAAIYELCRDGYAGQITMATDTYLKILTRRFGGGGYCHLTTSVLPNLEEVGVSKGDLHQMTVLNPARILAIA
jgi:phosphotriesterase-related protein